MSTPTAATPFTRGSGINGTKRKQIGSRFGQNGVGAESSDRIAADMRLSGHVGQHHHRRIPPLPPRGRDRRNGHAQTIVAKIAAVAHDQVDRSGRHRVGIVETHDRRFRDGPAARIGIGHERAFGRETRRQNGPRRQKRNRRLTALLAVLSRIILLLRMLLVFGAAPPAIPSSPPGAALALSAFPASGLRRQAFDVGIRSGRSVSVGGLAAPAIRRSSATSLRRMTVGAGFPFPALRGRTLLRRGSRRLRLSFRSALATAFLLTVLAASLPLLVETRQALLAHDVGESRLVGLGLEETSASRSTFCPF